MQLVDCARSSISPHATTAIDSESLTLLLPGDHLTKTTTLVRLRHANNTDITWILDVLCPNIVNASASANIGWSCVGRNCTPFLMPPQPCRASARPALSQLLAIGASVSQSAASEHTPPPFVVQTILGRVGASDVVEGRSVVPTGTVSTGNSINRARK